MSGEPLIDWTRLQDQLHSLAVRCLQDFAGSHADEEFYGFAFDCHAEYGQVLLCLNTQIDFEKSRQEYAVRHPNWTDADFDDLRWSLGDWTYQGFESEGSLDEVFEEEWKEFKDLLADQAIDQFGLDDPASTAALFLDSVCRVAVRMENDGVFSCLRRTKDFDVLVIDHEENVTTARERLDDVRRHPIDPTLYERSKALTTDYRRRHEIQQMVDDDRRTTCPHGDAKLLLRDSALGQPYPSEDGWWVVYENVDRAMVVAFDPTEHRYRLNLPNRESEVLSNIRSVAERLSG